MNLGDLLWTAISLLLTVAVLSYVLGDNPLFRSALAVFVGVGSAVVALMTFNALVYPRLVQPALAGTGVPWVGLALSVLLLGGASQRFALLARAPLAVLAGVSAGLIVLGAVVGTLVPQSMATVGLFDPGAGGSANLAEGLVTLLGVISTLAYFQFHGLPTRGGAVQRPAPLNRLAPVGQVFLGITLAAFAAGVLGSAIFALVERLAFVVQTLQELL